MHERQQRADTGRGQRGKNGDRMDEALVKHAENDVDSDQSGENEQRFVGERIVERRRSALEIGLQAGGKLKVLRPTLSMSVMAVPSEAFGARLNDTVTEGNCPWWLIESASVVSLIWVKALSGMALAPTEEEVLCSGGPWRCAAAASTVAGAVDCLRRRRIAHRCGERVRAGRRRSGRGIRSSRAGAGCARGGARLDVKIAQLLRDPAATAGAVSSTT